MNDCERKFTFPAKFASARSQTSTAETQRDAGRKVMNCQAKSYYYTLFCRKKKIWSEESRFLMTYDINNQINNCYTDSYVLTNDILNDIKTT